MMDFITTPLTTAIVFYFIYRLFELFVRRSERMMYISKMRDNCPANLHLPDLWPRRMGSFSALRVGCLILGLGLGLLVAFFINAMALPGFTSGKTSWEMRQVVGTVYGACVLIFGGAGLIVSYAVENHSDKKHTESSQHDEPAHEPDETTH